MGIFETIGTIATGIGGAAAFGASAKTLADDWKERREKKKAEKETKPVVETPTVTEEQ